MTKGLGIDNDQEMLFFFGMGGVKLLLIVFQPISYSLKRILVQSGFKMGSKLL